MRWFHGLSKKTTSSKLGTLPCSDMAAIAFCSIVRGGAMRGDAHAGGGTQMPAAVRSPSPEASPAKSPTRCRGERSVMPGKMLGLNLGLTFQKLRTEPVNRKSYRYFFLCIDESTILAIDTIKGQHQHVTRFNRRRKLHVSRHAHKQINWMGRCVGIAALQ